MKLMTTTKKKRKFNMTGYRTILSKGIMSASAVTRTEQCEQKAYYEYEDGYQSVSLGGGLKTGLSMHDGQEMYLNGSNEAAVISSVEAEAEVSGWDEDELFLPKIRSYIRGYYEHWEVADADQIADGYFELLGTEMDFDFDVEGIKFTGRMDAVLYDGYSDCIILMEHKNVSSKESQDYSSVFWKSLSMNNQATIYSTYLSLKYKKPVKLWYDVVITSPLSKPKYKPVKTINKVKQPKERETIEEFEERLTSTYKNKKEKKYLRRMIPVMEEDRSKRMQEIVAIAKKAQAFGYHANPLRNTTSCRDYGGCQFLGVCIGEERIYESSKFQVKPHFKEEDSSEQPF